MNRLIAYVLLFAFLGLSFDKVIILVHYQLNKAEITEKYCENKDKPGMHCCGKCHLKKQLAQEDEKQKLPSSAEVKFDIQLFANNNNNDYLTYRNGVTTLSYIYKDSFLSAKSSTIFRPPCA